MEIQRIDTYADSRFSECALFQHGCFLVEGKPYEIEIISDFEAVVRGEEKEVYLKIIEEFRFYAPHITKFYNSRGNIIKEYSTVFIKTISLEEIQPSQFYVDEIKKQAVSDFVHTEEDLIIPLVNWEGHNVSVDGHTRLFVAAEKGIQNVYGFYTEAGDYVRDFAAEAIKRNIVSPYQLIEVKHEDYEKLWFAFCDEYFSSK